MDEFIVKTQTLPMRCEVCHQSDCFDAYSNICSRCQGIEKLKIKSVALNPRAPFVQLRPRTFLYSYGAGAIAPPLLIFTLGPLFGFNLLKDSADILFISLISGFIGSAYLGTLILFGVVIYQRIKIWQETHR
jgi:hypothetical protein